MPLFYYARQSSLATKEGAKLWHLSLKKVGRAVDAQQLAEVIAEKSSLTPGDVHNVIRNLMTVMRSQLLNSRTVRLDGLGTFTMKARTRGKGVVKSEDVNPNQVTALRCQFTPEYTRPAAIGTTRARLPSALRVPCSKGWSLRNGREWLRTVRMMPVMVVIPVAVPTVTRERTR